MSKAEERGKTYALHKASEKLHDYYGNAMLSIVQFDGYDIKNAYIDGYNQAEQDLTDKAKVSSGWDGFYYGQGYKQAEKDLELTWEDIRDICRMWMESKTPFGVTGEALSIEVLKRFKVQKEGEKISDIKSGDKN